MSYMEIMRRALKNRSVNAAAKAWGLKQQTLDKYAKGERVPSPTAAKIMMKEAGVTAEEMLDALAELDAKLHHKVAKISEGFKALLRVASAGFLKEIPAA